jgi:hypothetical protein
MVEDEDWVHFRVSRRLSDGVSTTYQESGCINRALLI